MKILEHFYCDLPHDFRAGTAQYFNPMSFELNKLILIFKLIYTDRKHTFF